MPGLRQDNPSKSGRIREYWLVNLIDRRIEVHRTPTAGGYADIRSYTADEELHPLAQPEAVLRPSWLWSPT
ncbi:MAG: hypothetical protein ABSF26_13370 [Thermoguttaceae bacterium]|jgi:Uma2 family endonuclease